MESFNVLRNKVCSFYFHLEKELLTGLSHKINRCERLLFICSLINNVVKTLAQTDRMFDHSWDFSEHGQTLVGSSPVMGCYLQLKLATRLPVTQ